MEFRIKTNRLRSSIKHALLAIINNRKVKGRTKYFCIGRNKTGTTSLAKAFKQLGFILGDQREAEYLYDEFFSKSNFLPIIKYCQAAEVFQDVPFSYFKTLKYIDEAYPGSKFILTVRDNSDQWYNSITKFHKKLFGKGERVPTTKDLAEASYVRKGFAQNAMKDHGTSIEDPYNKKIMCAHYEKHNADVLAYFKDRPNDLLIINLSDESAYQKFVVFIGIDSPYKDFPWENKT